MLPGSRCRGPGSLVILSAAAGVQRVSETFDPYRKWLGIPPAEQPPDHYRLLGIGRFEDDPDTISNAADRQMTHLRTFQPTGS